MPRQQSDKRVRSKSPSRRSRSRSRGRSRSPARTKAKAKASPSPSRKPRSPARKTKVTTPGTPQRTSARIAEKEELQKEIAAKSLENNVKDEATTARPISKVEEKKQETKQEKKVEKMRTFKEILTALVYFMAIILLPTILLSSNLACGKVSCSVTPVPRLPRDTASYFNGKAMAVLIGWVAYQLLLSILPLGPIVEGQPSPRGDRLKYRCNGFYVFLVTLVAFGLASYLKVPLSYVHEHLTHLMVADIIFATILSVFVFLRARKSPAKALSSDGNTGSVPADFFNGKEVNPRLGSVDLKVFSMRTGKITWTLLDLYFLREAYQNTNQVDLTLALLVAFHFIYTADTLWFEEAALTMKTVNRDGYGFMAVFGSFCWIPFMYSLQARFLLSHPQTWSYASLAAISLLNVFGYVMYRGSNSQKDQFRRNPNDPALSYLESMPSSSGQRLLVSGWWGLVRHPNYLGELLMSLAWALLCGYLHVLPFLQFIILTLVLVVRAVREDATCRRKHSAAWDRYCQRVRYRLIPYIF